MRTFLTCLYFACLLLVPGINYGALKVGVGRADITPPEGSPSAGYASRKGLPMQGVRDPLLATSLYIDNGAKKVVFCSVDHLGFTYDMVQEIVKKIKTIPGNEDVEIYVGSSHTHSGGGAYFDMPLIGESLAGVYNPETRKFYIDSACESINKAVYSSQEAEIGIGYGHASDLSKYVGLYPLDIKPTNEVMVMKVVDKEKKPLAVLFSYALHPTVFKGDNKRFSADFVGFTREELKKEWGSDLAVVYFNGAQGDLQPFIADKESCSKSCQYIADSLTNTIKRVWANSSTASDLDVKTYKKSYSFKPKATPFGLLMPVESYHTEINLIVLNKIDAFVTIPGELSTLYDTRYKKAAKKLKYRNLTVLGLTNDAHGYIITPESWDHATKEAALSFGGRNYGYEVESYVMDLLHSK